MSGLYAAPSLSSLKIGTFKGIDVSVPEDQQKPYRAANANNMMPDASGEARKRPGFQKDHSFTLPELNRGETIYEIINKKIWIVKAPQGVGPTAEYYISYIYMNGKYVKFSASLQPPKFIPYGDWHIAFVRNKNTGGYAVNTECGKIGEMSGMGFEAAFALIRNDRIVAFDDRYYRYEYTGSEWKTPTLIQPDDADLKTPLTMRFCNSAGGGSAYEQVNLLNPWVTETFYVKDRASVFYLNGRPINPYATNYDADIANNARYDGLTANGMFRVEQLLLVDEKETAADTGSVKVARWVKRPLSGDDGYRPSANRLYLSPAQNQGLAYKTDYGEEITVNGGTGEDGLIGPSPEEDQDNIRITYMRYDYRQRLQDLCECVCGTAFGVSGHRDRLFLGGYGAEKNKLFYSETEDPLYIGDLNFIETEPGSQIMGLSGLGDALTILTDRGICFAKGEIRDTSAEVTAMRDSVFKISAVIPAPVPIGTGSATVFGGEIVYLSTDGVIAVASGDNYDARYAEHRSAMINRQMLPHKPKRLVGAGRYLLIQCDYDICWVLDEYQPTSDGDRPYSKRQFEGFRLSGIKGHLFYEGGSVYSFYNGLIAPGIYQWTDGTQPNHYHDDWDGTETAIEAYWETPWLYGDTFYRKKVFMKLGILLGQIPGANTSVKVEAKKNVDPEWSTLWEPDGTLCTFSFSKLDFRYFTFKGLPGNPDMVRKIKIKKALRVKLRLSNNEFNQPFILQELGMDYVSES